MALEDMSAVGGVSMSDGPFLVIDSPEGLNRLWFLGGLIQGFNGPKGRESGIAQWISSRVLATVEVPTIKSASEQWARLWAHTCRRRQHQVTGALEHCVKTGLDARPVIPLDMPELGLIESLASHAFDEWWAAPTGAKFALAWLIEQVDMKLSSGVLTEALHTVKVNEGRLHLDVVGDSDAIERCDGYARCGSRALFPPKKASIERILRREHGHSSVGTRN